MLDFVEGAHVAADGFQGQPSAARATCKGIAVCGSHPVTLGEAPFEDQAWLIYACSPDNTPYGLGKSARAIPRCDQFFEVHCPLEHASRPYAYLHYVAQMPFVWMRDERALASGLFKGGRRYPDEEMRGRKRINRDGSVDFAPGIFHRSQFKSSIAFMMAKAICDIEAMRKTGEIEGPGIIGLWGILQAGQGEYEYQRSSTQYFLEEAAKRGIRVLVAAESKLFHDDPELF